MKSLIKVFALLIVWSSSAWITPQEASAQGSVSFQLFYDELSPYGRWVDYPNYGYVWMPDVDREFSPYGTDGHWVFTEDGWTWVSDYPWGWAPFHYGRWAFDDSYGWLWVPHNEWGPAWVTWRRSPGYYGWAPMGPGISIEVSFGGEYRVPHERWIFVRDRDISRPDIDRHYVDRSTNVTIINNSTVINNTYMDNNRHTKYVAGPARDDVQKVTGSTIRPVAIRENDKPGQTLRNDQLQIYRPQVQKRKGDGQNPAPSKVMKLNDVRPASERNAGNRQQQPPRVNPPDKGQPPQQRDVIPSDKKGRQQQPPRVNPPNKGQPPQQRDVIPSDKKGREQQPPRVNPPDKGQPPQTRDIVPIDSKGREQKPGQPRDVIPSTTKGREQKPPTVNPPNKVQPPQPPDVNPSNSRGKKKPPQNVTPPDKNRKEQPSQPKPNQDEKKKRKRE